MIMILIFTVVMVVSRGDIFRNILIVLFPTVHSIGSRILIKIGHTGDLDGCWFYHQLYLLIY